MGTVGLLCISISAYLVGNVLKKVYTNKFGENTLLPTLYTALVSLFVCIFFLFFGINTVSTFTLLLSVAFGVVLVLSTLLNVKAFSVGPMSLSTVIISFSTVFTAASGAIFYGETITWSHIVGIVLMLTSFIFAANKNKDDKKASVKWLVICILASIFCGMIGILQKIHQTSIYKGELNEFLFISFFFSTLNSLIWLIIAFKKGGNKFSSLNLKDNKKNIIACLLICIVSGIATGTNHKLNLFLSGVMDSATFFPLVNGAGLVLSTLSALFIFRERLSVKQWISVIVGVLSVIFLCNPF